MPRLAYPAATNAFALVRLLPVSDRDKDIEILALRHQPLVLQRRVGKPAFTDTDRMILGQARDVFPDRGMGGWAPDRSAARGVVPLRGDEPAMPGEQSARGDRKVFAPAES
jgi:hypothetical protein